MTSPKDKLIQRISASLKTMDVETLSLIDSIVHPQQNHTLDTEIRIGAFSTEILCPEQEHLNGIVVNHRFVPIEGDTPEYSTINKLRQLLISEDEEAQNSGFLLAETLINTEEDFCLLMGMTAGLYLEHSVKNIVQNGTEP